MDFDLFSFAFEEGGCEESWGQFHQRSTHSFCVRKLRAQLFYAYISGLYFTGARLLVQKLRVECW
jgi:hypothetical protein